MPWIMEVYTLSHKTDKKGLRHREWRGVRPSGKNENVYRYETKDEAAHMLRICYPDQCREYRLGATLEECGVRIRHVTMEELERMNEDG